MKIKSISKHIKVSVVLMTLGINGGNLLLAQASAGKALSVKQNEAEDKPNAISQLIHTGHSAHELVVAVEGMDSQMSGKSGVITKICKPLGFVSGATQGFTAAQELAAGHVKSGCAHGIGATANTFSACAGYAGSEALCKMSGAAGAGIDGTLEIYNGICSDQFEKTAVGGLKCSVSAMMLTSAVQPELAPVLVPVATATYVGAITIDVVYENKDAISDAIVYLPDNASTCYDSAISTVVQIKSAAVYQSQDALSEMKDSVRSKASDVAWAVHEGSQRLHDFLFN